MNFCVAKQKKKVFSEIFAAECFVFSARQKTQNTQSLIARDDEKREKNGRKIGQKM